MDTNATGNVTSSSYDNFGRLAGTTYSDSSPTLGYTYDLNDNVATMSQGSVTTDYTVNANDNVTAVENMTTTATLHYGYDANGNITSIEYPNSQTVTKAYNGLNQLTSIEDWNSHTTSFTYDGDGQLASISYPNGVTNTNVYNNAEQILSMTDVLSGSTIASFTYGRDSNGQASSQATTGMPGSSSISYSYNPLSELSAAGSSSYSYDSAQNLITAPNGDNQKFNADAQLCWQGSGTSSTCTAPTGATSYAYSDEGNRTSMTPSGGTATTYGWNQLNQLTDFTPTSGSATSYTYDDAGLLTTETTSSSTKNFVWDTQASTPEMVSDGTNHYLYGPTTTPIEQIAASGGTTSYLLADDLGSVRAITNSTGTITITGAVSYDAWGNTSSTSGTISTPFGFTGAYFDSASGLYYMQARWYDATTGQWMSLDPNLTQTREPYSYVSNNRVNSCDPMGQVDCKQLAQKILAAAETASTRYEELVANVQDLSPTGPNSIASHQKAFRQSQNPLRNLLDQWDRSGCGGKGIMIPDNIRALAEAPAPVPGTNSNGFHITTNEVIGGLVVGGLIAIGFLTGDIGDLILLGG